MKNKGYAKCWGANKVYYERCANGEFKNFSRLCKPCRSVQSLFTVESNPTTNSCKQHSVWWPNCQPECRHLPSFVGLGKLSVSLGQQRK